jgi:hypothetical protein
MTRLRLAAVVLLTLPSLAWAETRTFDVTVRAGDHDRENVPVSVRVVLQSALAKATSAVVSAPESPVRLAQLTEPGLASAPVGPEPGVHRDLHFLVPRLKAGAVEQYRVTVTEGATPKANAFRWEEKPGEQIDLLFGDRPVLRYMHKALDESSKAAREATFKVYHHLFDPAGTRLVTKGPGGKYTHHRGLFYGFNRVTYGPDNRKADIWHCTGDTFQEHEKVVRAEAGPVLGRHLLQIAWHGVKKEVFARELRELTAYSVPGGQLIEFRSRLEPVISPVRLDGDPQHAGFHFRADDEVSSKTAKQTYYLRPDGQGKSGETRNWDPKTRKGPVNLPWNVMSFVLGGQRYSAVYLDRPANPKEARYSERDYGRFGSYFEYEVRPDRPLEVAYRVWLQAGDLTGPQAAGHSANFVSPVEVVVK